MLFPLKIISPSSGLSEPQIRFKRVVLPLPFEPITETNSPFYILKLKWSKTVASSTVPTLKRFVIFFNSSTLFPPFLCFLLKSSAENKG